MEKKKCKQCKGKGTVKVKMPCGYNAKTGRGYYISDEECGVCLGTGEKTFLSRVTQYDWKR